jgi:poly(A) polymerase
MDILTQDGARAQLEVLDRLDLLCRIIPELELTKGVAQPKAHHYWDVWNHNLHTVEYAELVTRGHQNSAIYSLAPWNAAVEAYFAEEVGDGFSRRTVLKLAGLLHDIAKPQTKAPDKTGRIRFLGHSELGAEMVTERLTQLRFSARIVAMLSRMVFHHLRPAQLRHGDADPTPRAMHRYYRDVGDVAVDTIYLALADYLGAKGPEVVADRWANHARMLGNLLQAGREKAPAKGTQRLLTGHDLMQRLALPPGPLIGRLLAQIDEARAAGEVATREEALALADTLEKK